MTEIITTAEELDEFVDAMETDYVFATDANAQPWIIYSTEDDVDAVTFPMETEDGRTEVEVSDLIASIDGLGLPLTILYRPGQPVPSLPPTVEQIADAIEAELKARTFLPDVTGQGGIGLSSHQLAEAVHKLYPTCQPSREQIESVVIRQIQWQRRDGMVPEYEVANYCATQILALIPGRSEAEVKAEALREAADAADREKVDSLLPGVIGLSWLRDRADRIAGGEGRD